MSDVRATGARVERGFRDTASCVCSIAVNVQRVNREPSVYFTTSSLRFAVIFEYSNSLRAACSQLVSRRVSFHFIDNQMKTVSCAVQTVCP